MSEINATAGKIEGFLATYKGTGGLPPVEVQVRPSGDDTDVIKIWIDLGAAGAGADTDAWATACEAAIRAAIPLGSARLKLRVETGA